MIKRTTKSRVTAEEREVTINIYPNKNGEWTAFLYSCIEKYANRCKKQGWTQISETRHADGYFVSAEFTAPAKAISIRNANLPKRKMTEEQREAASKRFEEYRKSKETET